MICALPTGSSHLLTGTRTIKQREASTAALGDETESTRSSGSGLAMADFLRSYLVQVPSFNLV